MSKKLSLASYYVLTLAKENKQKNPWNIQSHFLRFFPVRHLFHYNLWTGPSLNLKKKKKSPLTLICNIIPEIYYLPALNCLYKNKHIKLHLHC